MAYSWRVIAAMGLILCISLYCISIGSILSIEYTTTTTSYHDARDALSLNLITAPSKLVSYRVHRDNFFTNLNNPYMQCSLQNKKRPRAELPASIANLLNFTTTVDIGNLRVIVVGDSVGVQMVQGLQEAVIRNYHNDPNFTSRTVFRYSWGTHEGNSVLTTQKGGAVAGWRLTKWLLMKNENKPLPNNGAGGWLRTDVEEMLLHISEMRSANRSSSATDASSIDNRKRILEANSRITDETTNHLTEKRKESFDVMIMKIPHGWMQLEEITRQGFMDSVKAAQKVLGVSNIIVLNLPLINNVATDENLELLRRINQMIQNVSDSLTEAASAVDDDLQNILVLDVDRFTSEFLKRNEQHLLASSVGSAAVSQQQQSIISSNSTTQEVNTYRCCPQKQRITSNMVHVCDELVPPNSRNCRRNRFTIDGLHFCPETWNGPLNAGIACLLSCIYNNPHQGQAVVHRQGKGSTILDCSRRCNDRFMNFRPIEFNETNGTS